MSHAKSLRPRALEPDFADVPDIAIRLATREDRAAICRILLQAYRQYRWVMRPDVHRLHLAELLDLDTRPPGSALLVAEAGGRVVGNVTYVPPGASVAVAWPGDLPMVRALAVAPDARGLGAGRALMLACLDRARAASAPAVGLHTADFMSAAVALYQSLGFQRAPHLDIDFGKTIGGEVGPTLMAGAYVLLLG